MKKKISLVLALLLTASVFTGCKSSDDIIGGIPALTESSVTQRTFTYADNDDTDYTYDTADFSDFVTETESEFDITKEFSDDINSESEFYESESDISTSAPEAEYSSVNLSTTAKLQASTTASVSWNETAISEVLYVKQACYSRAKAEKGSKTVKQYAKGTKVTVVAATDTGYYKLADGSFIQASFLTEKKPSTTTATAKTTTAKTTTAKTTTAKTTTAKTTTGTTSAASKNGVISTSYYVDYTTRYGYKTLNSKEKKLYANLVEAISNLKSTCEVPDGLLSEDITRVYGMVYYQEPQLFWMSTKAPSGYNTIELSYLLTDKSKIQKMQDKIDAKAAEVMKKVNAYSGAVSKIKVIYDYIVLNNDFELAGDGYTSSIYNGITGDHLQCAGYAKSFMYLCDIAGIECVTIPGMNFKGDTHAWNKVYAENGYYNIDATWGDPKNDYDSNYIRYSFFLVPDSWIKTTHLYPNSYQGRNNSRVTYFTPPAATKTACNYFTIFNKEYSSLASAEKAMYAEFDAAFAAKKNTVHIRVTTKDIFSTLVSDSYAKTFQKYAKTYGNVSSLSRQTTYNEGVLVVQYDITYNK